MLKRLLIAAAAVALAPVSAEAAWPERPITMIVPWAAGGGTDAVGRIIAAGLEKELGKPVNVVNRTGGGGVVGHTEIINARPDGYTIGIATAEVTTYYWANTAPYTYDKLAPIALVNFDHVAFYVAEGSPWKTLGEALAGIKAAPFGTYKMSGMPVGAAYHLAFSRLLQSEGIDAKTVPVVPNQGAAQGFQELVSGGVQVLPSSLPEGKTMVDAKRARVLAVLAADRLSAFPDVPTVKQAIGREVVGGTWRGVAGPAGLPADVSARLIDAVEKVVNTPEFKNFMAERGFGLAWAKGPEFGVFLAEQHKNNGEVMNALGLRLRQQ